MSYKRLLLFQTSVLSCLLVAMVVLLLRASRNRQIADQQDYQGLRASLLRAAFAEAEKVYHHA